MSGALGRRETGAVVTRPHSESRLPSSARHGFTAEAASRWKGDSLPARTPAGVRLALPECRLRPLLAIPGHCRAKAVMPWPTLTAAAPRCFGADGECKEHLARARHALSVPSCHFLCTLCPRLPFPGDARRPRGGQCGFHRAVVVTEAHRGEGLSRAPGPS